MKKSLRFSAIVFILLAGYYTYRGADLYFNQAKYVYHPKKNWVATPASEGLAFDDLTLRASDGVKLSAWYVPAKEPRGSVLFLHGNARNMSSDIDALQMFHELGFSVLAVDYRGYGKSEGTPDEEGTYRDAQAGWDALVGLKGESPQRIVICGRSLGAAIAAELAQTHEPKALILEAAFTTLSDAGQARYPYFPVKLLSRYHYDTIHRLPSIHCPVLIVHSHDDELIPFGQARQNFAAVTGTKAFVDIGGPHKGGYQPTLDKYHRGIRDFLV